MGTRKFQTVPPYNGSNERQVLQALQDVVSYVTAQSKPAIQPLGASATTAEIIAKVNEIVARLQGTT